MVNPDTPLEKSKIEESIFKLREIQQGLKQNLVNLHLKLDMIASTSWLQRNLENFKVDFELRASDLEAVR